MEGGLKAAIELKGDDSTLVKSVCLFHEPLVSHIKVPLEMHLCLTAFRDILPYILMEDSSKK